MLVMATIQWHKSTSVLEFIKNTDTETVVVSTSDHETGGLSVARQLHSTYPEYLWKPEVLNGSHSAEHLAGRLHNYLSSSESSISSRVQLKNYVTKLVKEGLGIFDATEDELELLVNRPHLSVYTFADMISRRAQLGWSTHGHSAVDVNVYGSPGSEALRGNNENTDIGKFLAQYLGLDVAAVTEKLRAASLTSETAESDQFPIEDYYHVGL